MNRVAIAIAAHPDDIEFGMAGTLILLKAAGFQIHYLNLGNGNCGTDKLDTAAIVRLRREEAQRAAALIGAQFHESLVNDLEIFYSEPLLRQVGAIVREVQPGIILTHSPQDYMEDHETASRLAVSGAFTRGMLNFLTEPRRLPVAHEVAIYHAMPHGLMDPLRRRLRAEFYVDVGPVMDLKTRMLACHTSQKEWLDVSQGMDSYLHSLRDLARALGRLSGRFEYAEGWRRHSHLGFSAKDEEPLAAVLRDRCVFDPVYARELEG